MRCLPISCLKASDCTVTAVPRDLEVPISDDDAASKVMHPEVACVMAGQLQELRAAMLQEGIKGFGCTAEGCGRVQRIDGAEDRGQELPESSQLSGAWKLSELHVLSLDGTVRSVART